MANKNRAAIEASKATATPAQDSTPAVQDAPQAAGAQQDSPPVQDAPAVQGIAHTLTYSSTNSKQEAIYKAGNGAAVYVTGPVAALFAPATPLTLSTTAPAPAAGVVSVTLLFGKVWPDGGARWTAQGSKGCAYIKQGVHKTLGSNLSVVLSGAPAPKPATSAPVASGPTATA